jgi:hypothetical protein
MLSEFSLIGLLYTLRNFVKTREVARILGLLFCRGEKYFNVIFFLKTGWATSWAIFP